MDTTHLIALQDRLSREYSRLASASTVQEKNFRTMKVAQAKREVEGELHFLGMNTNAEQINISDDDLLAALGN